MTQKKQVLQGLQVLFLLFNCQTPAKEEVRDMMLRHTRMEIGYKGEYTGIREMRKHISWYTAGYPNSAKLRGCINEVESYQKLEEMLMERF